MKLPFKITKSILLLAAIISSLSSCKNTVSKDHKKETSLHFSMHRDLGTLDPRKGSELATATVHFLLYEGLTRPKTDGTIEPAQAKEIIISPDGLHYTFILKDTFWSDGTKVTAYDFERSWRSLLSPDFPSSNAHLLYPIVNAEAAKKGLVTLDKVGVKAIDEKTLEVELQMQAPYFLEILCFTCFHPVKENISSANPKQLVVNGPYQLKEWKFNTSLTLEKNPAYWDKSNIKTDKIFISIIDNENTALSMFEKKQLDFIGGPLAPLPMAAISKLVKEKRLKIQPVAGSTVCFFNTKAFPFHNIDMRKAFAYALSREEIVKNITQLGETPASSVVPPILKKGKSSIYFSDNNAELARFHFNKALQDLGIQASDLDGLTYLYSNRQEHHQIAQVLQQQWKEVLGVNVSIQSLEHKTLLDKLCSKNYSFGQTIWLAQYNDPLAILERFKEASYTKNYSGWEDSLYSSLLEQSYHFPDPRKRHLLLEEAENIMIEEMPLIPLYHWSYAFLIQDNVKNVSFSSLGSINITEIEVEKDHGDPISYLPKTYTISSNP